MTIAGTWWQRWRGLIGAPPLAPFEALFIPYCRRVHTWLMRVPFDAAFVNREGIIVAIFPSLPPWRITPRVPEARHCLELPAGGIERYHLAVGDSLPLSLLWQLPLHLFLAH